jgi:hypothetical protein
MAVGLPAKTTYADGDVFSASDINDTNGTINLIGQTTNFYAGKNKIINGDFGVWQRGTSFSPTSAAIIYTADRFISYNNGSGVVTVSRQTFTPGTAPVSGYEGQFFHRTTCAASLGTTTGITTGQPIEDVRTFAGQTVTVSFWMKIVNSQASPIVSITLNQNFGSGGSGTVSTNPTSSIIQATTSWARYSYTYNVPSISGKTIGTSSFLRLEINLTAQASQSYDIWGVQIEAGSTATAFQTATGTIQGELAACQRYYLRHNASSANAFERVGLGSAASTTTASIEVPLPVQLRTNPSSIEFSGLSLFDGTAFTAVTNCVLDNAGVKIVVVVATVASGLSQFRPYQLGANNNANMFLGISAEL